MNHRPIVVSPSYHTVLTPGLCRAHRDTPLFCSDHPRATTCFETLKSCILPTSCNGARYGHCRVVESRDPVLKSPCPSLDPIAITKAAARRSSLTRHQTLSCLFGLDNISASGSGRSLIIVGLPICTCPLSPSPLKRGPTTANLNSSPVPPGHQLSRPAAQAASNSSGLCAPLLVRPPSPEPANSSSNARHVAVTPKLITGSTRLLRLGAAGNIRSDSKRQSPGSGSVVSVLPDANRSLVPAQQFCRRARAFSTLLILETID